MARWEYRTLDFTKPKKDLEALNRLGADGWEAVAMVTTCGVSEMRVAHPVVHRKRPLPDGPQQAP
jgi:hypothetical protein